MNCPASSTISMSQRPRAAPAELSRTRESVVVVMPPACAAAHGSGESLLILVLPVPGYHGIFIPNEQWCLRQVPSSTRAAERDPKTSARTISLTPVP
jgi:hypothetical protein